MGKGLDGDSPPPDRGASAPSVFGDRTLSADRASNSQHVTRPAVALPSAYRVNEPELIARVLAGDRIAARELYDAHSPRVFRLAFRLTGDADLAREFTQDTFVRAFSQLARFRGDSALSTWLHRITVTVVANAMRKVKRFRERETDLEDVHPIGSDGAGVDPVLRERLHRAIEHCLRSIERRSSCTISKAIPTPRSPKCWELLKGPARAALSQARAQLRATLR